MNFQICDVNSFVMLCDHDIIKDSIIGLRCFMHLFVHVCFIILQCARIYLLVVRPFFHLFHFISTLFLTTVQPNHKNSLAQLYKVCGTQINVVFCSEFTELNEL